VSTYPGVTAVLGELRRRGRLRVPCYSSITDLAGLHFWAHPGIDRHFITHPESAAEVEQIAGRESVKWAKPPTSTGFLAARTRADARRELALPGGATVIAVSGGGWGVGDLLGATAAALEVPEAIVLCLCGRNDKLRERIARRFGDEPRLRLMGFTDRMSDILTASDALVHSSGGLTILEAIIRGCPVISYGFSYGHVRATETALRRFDLAQVARHRSEIGPALANALQSRPDPDPTFARQPSTASLIFADERRIQPLSAWRLRSARAATSSAVVIALLAWALTTGASYKLVSNFVHMRPLTAVATTRPEVGVLVDAPAGELPALANSLTGDGMRASFAVNGSFPPQRLGSLGSGDQAVPRLPNGGLVRWLGTRGQLRRLLRRLGYGRHFLYASNGPSVGQWWMAHGAGGRLIAGAVRLDDSGDALGSLHPGEVIELRVGNLNDGVALLGRLRQRLGALGLTGVPVGRLMRDAGISA
ncbi:MAG TPA: hypothetical protein VLP43_02105, partial [Solirubrobacteraceae bacterium]|nr:hypothetical protein [Solirubrobacteraceae bacterium]